MDVQVNMWGVLAATVSAMVVGSIWYSPIAFSNTWARLAKIDTSKKNVNIWKPLLLTAIVTLLSAYVLAHVSYLAHQFFQNSFLQDAVSTAFWMWLGFFASRLITHDVFEGRPAKLTLITIGSELVTFLVMGLMIGVIGL